MTFLPNTTPLRVEDLQALPEHIAAEAAALAKGRNERNLLTEFELRALIASSGIWLAVHGVTNRKDAPNVIQKWCQLLKHAGLTEAIFHKGERSTPISLETRVCRWLSDYIQRPAEDVPGPKGWRLEVAADAKLDTPMRDLDGKGRIRRARPRPLSSTRTRARMRTRTPSPPLSHARARPRTLSRTHARTPLHPLSHTHAHARAHAHTHALAPSLARACTPSPPLSHQADARRAGTSTGAFREKHCGRRSCPVEFTRAPVEFTRAPAGLTVGSTHRQWP